MKVGDLIYDSFYKQTGIIVSVSENGRRINLLYADGDIHENVNDDLTIKVIVNTEQ